MANKKKITIAEKTVLSLALADLPEGEAAPVNAPDDPSWDLIAPWDDPLASREHGRSLSGKRRVCHRGVPALEFDGPDELEHALVAGDPDWREYAVTARFQCLRGSGPATFDDPGNRDARVGLVFRMETLRRYYFFGVENQRRLVLYRRDDEQWLTLAAREAPIHERIITLRVDLDADSIRARCLEQGREFLVTDHDIRSGPAGFRALGACRLFALSVKMTPGQAAGNRHRTGAAVAALKRREETLPAEEAAGEISLAGGRDLVACADFHASGRHDLLFASPEGLCAGDWEGKTRWELSGDFRQVKVASSRRGTGKLIFAISGRSRRGGKIAGESFFPGDELVTIDGASGRLLARVELPENPAGPMVRFHDLSRNTGSLDGRRADDVLVREWRKDLGNGGSNAWAYDADLNLLWHASIHPPYGHHNAVCFFDADGDGREEVLAGGVLLDGAGRVRWTHDRAEEMTATLGGGHYDAAVIGASAGDNERDPTVFLAGGSAGLYIADGLTGRTRAVHRLGHAQWLLPCKVRADLPGREVLAGTRWGNYGIITLFSGAGDRLWTIQPDYLGQGTMAVRWLPDGPDHIWVNTTRRAFGLYDGKGRLVRPLEKMRALYGDRFRRRAFAMRRAPDGTDYLGLQSGETIHLFSGAS